MANLVPLPRLTRPWWREMRWRRLKTIVNGKSMSQAELARRITAQGIRMLPDGVQQMEAGRRRTQHRDVLNAIERALELPADLLYDIQQNVPYVPRGQESPFETLLDVETSGPSILVHDLTPGMEALLTTVHDYPDEVLFRLIEVAPELPKRRTKPDETAKDQQA